ncbi:response regulator transcription factor [Kitasatospora sp. NPDC048540]|uniref:response regulator transcription factor n=1 Tax=Kitasatospora sp. NPDC048540 TaxID=3155634 RepID=UPI0033E397F9
MISVLLVDDEALVRAGLRMLLETADDLTVVGDADSGRTAVEAVDRLRPDVVLMDVRMPGTNGGTCSVGRDGAVAARTGDSPATGRPPTLRPPPPRAARARRAPRAAPRRGGPGGS